MGQGYTALGDSFLLENQDYLSVDKSFGITRCTEWHVSKWLHTHEFIEISYIHSGDGSTYYRKGENGEIIERPISRGDVMIVEPDSYHSIVSRDPSNPIITYNIMFTTHFLDENLSTQLTQYSLKLPQFFDFLDFQKVDLPMIHLNDVDQTMLDQIVNLIFIETVQKEIGYFNILKAYVVQILIKISRAFLANLQQPNKNAINHVLTQQIMEYINETYNSRLNLDVIAARFSFTRNYICKIFKKNTGMTLTEYQHMIRVEKACQRLVQTNQKIIDIAQSVGFCDYKAFYSVFCKITGKRPLEYRNQNRFSIFETKND